MQDVATWPHERKINNSWPSERSPYLHDSSSLASRVENNSELLAICRTILTDIFDLHTSDRQSIIDLARRLADLAFSVRYPMASSLITSPSQSSILKCDVKSDYRRIPSLQQAKRLNELFAHMETLRQDVQDDNSSDIDWPTDKACEEAEQFIRSLPLSVILSPKIYFAHDGEINFLWKRQDDGLHVDLGLYGNGTYSYFATNNNKEELMEDAANISQGLPDKLVEMLRV